MKFFSKKPSRKHAHASSGAPPYDDENDYLPSPVSSEPPSPTKSTTKSPTKNASAASLSAKPTASSTNSLHAPPISPSHPRTSSPVRPKKTNSASSSSSRHRSSRHTRPSAADSVNDPLSPSSTPSSSRRRKVEHTHPLNLPPEERHRLSLLSNMSGRDSMDTDGDTPGVTSSPPTPNPVTLQQPTMPSGSSPPVAQPLATGSPFKQRSQSPPQSSPPAQKPSSPAPAAAGPTTNGFAAAANSADSVPVPPPHLSPAPTPTDEAEAYKNAGNKYFKEKNYPMAVAEYTKGVFPVNLLPQSPTYLSNRAAAHMSAGNYASALEDCLRAADLDPINSKILLRLARIYTSLGQPEDALLTFSRIQPQPPAKDMASAKEMLHHVRAARDALQTGTAGSMVLHALDMASRQLGSGALQPRKWQLMRAEAYLKMGGENNLREATNLAISILRSNNQDPEALILRGRALYAQGDNSQAERHFRHAISLDPDMKDAIKWLRIVQKLDRMKEEGNREYKAGRWLAAITKYTEALSVDPTNRGINSKLLQNRALCRCKLKQYNEAIADCDQALSLDPQYTKARRTKANALGLAERWEDAVREWKALAEREPEDRTVAKELKRAELELKKSQRKDYYKILGVSKDVDEKEIKKAYRRLAVVHHPDKNPGDETAEARFKDIGEAYETLSDPHKRARYDSGDDLADSSDMFGGGGGGMHNVDPEIIFSMMGGQGGGPFGATGFGSGGTFPSGTGYRSFHQGGSRQSRGFPGNFQFQ